MAILSVPRRARIMLLPLVLLLSMTGCGEPEKLPPDQIIERAVPAIGNVSSFHFTMDTSKPQKPPSGIFITKVDGDVAKPDKLSGNLSAMYSGVPISVKIVVDGESQYWTDPASGQWQAMPDFFSVVDFFDPSKGVAEILGGVKDLVSDGTENVVGVDAYRLKGTVPTSALQALSREVTAKGDLAATLWIGAGDFLLRQVRLQGPLIEGEPADIVRTITIKDYNKTVKVETPVVK